MESHFDNEHIYDQDNEIIFRQNVAPAERPHLNTKKVSKTTSTHNSEEDISKTNGKLRIIFSAMVIISIVTLTVFGVQFHWISRLNLQNMEQNDQQSMTLKLIEELKNMTRVSEGDLINMMKEMNAATRNVTRTAEDNLVDMIKRRGCFMNLRPNMDGVTFSTSGASDSRSEAIFVELDDRSAISSTGSWCGRAGHNDSIDIKFEEARLVAGIVTQGSPLSDHWTKTYRIFCLSEQGSYKEYSENGRTKTFTGNSNRDTKVFNIFSETISCRSIRIIPKTWHGRPCLRIDLVHEGCYAPTSHKFVVTSRGADDGWYCSITVNGIEKASRGRGFCVLSFDPHSLTFKAASFDTYVDAAGQSPQMSSFLDSLQAYSVVAIAVQDTAVQTDKTVHSNILSRAKGLGAVGVSCNLAHVAVRDSFSFIGQKSRRPDWMRCLHVKRHGGYAVVHATINTSRRFIAN